MKHYLFYSIIWIANLIVSLAYLQREFLNYMFGSLKYSLPQTIFFIFPVIMIILYKAEKYEVKKCQTKNKKSKIQTIENF